MTTQSLLVLCPLSIQLAESGPVLDPGLQTNTVKSGSHNQVRVTGPAGYAPTMCHAPLRLMYFVFIIPMIYKVMAPL